MKPKASIATGLPRSMRAAAVHAYGGPDLLRLIEAPVPIVGDNEVLVRVCAAAVCRGDTHLLSGRPYLVRLSGFGVLHPRHAVPGQSLSGEIVAVGSAVTGLRTGDLVMTEVPHGGFAEFAIASPDRLARKPPKLSHAQAAALPLSGTTALQGLRDAGSLVVGQRVLINGASGAVGTLAIQIAKAHGATVTAVCSTRHIPLLQSLGADDVIDYTQADLTRSSAKFDLVFDLVANRKPRDLTRILKPGGRLVSGAVPADANWIGPLVWLAKVTLAGSGLRAKTAVLLAKPKRADLEALAEMVEAGSLRPVIEHRFPLAEIARAYKHVGNGHAQGATIVEVASC